MRCCKKFLVHKRDNGISRLWYDIGHWYAHRMTHSRIAWIVCLGIIFLGAMLFLMGYMRILPAVAAPAYCSVEGMLRDAIGLEHSNGVANCLRSYDLCCG